jgi:hypothetical protein
MSEKDAWERKKQREAEQEEFWDYVVRRLLPTSVGLLGLIGGGAILQHGEEAALLGVPVCLFALGLIGAVVKQVTKR